ncbi:MAG: hypothetical protein ACI857_000415 [Arenicella sp.]|jgi:hypothetical protein
MSKNLGLLILIILPIFTCSQEVFEYGEKFGVKYNSVVVHSAKYDKIVITDYFVAGKIEANWYNLAVDVERATKPYRRFNYDLKEDLLIYGVSLNGKIDLFNETGEFVYMEEGDYSKIRTTRDFGFAYNSDLVVVSKLGKHGLYNWPKKMEILPAINDKLVMHLDCEDKRTDLYLQKDGMNMVLNPFGEEVFTFRNKSIDDVYAQGDCDGYILKRGQKKGYARKLRSGKYFLIKPVYNELSFEGDNADIITVKKGEKHGLFYKNKQILRCKYDKIEITNNGYIMGFAYKNYRKISFDKEGKTVEVEFIDQIET